MNYVLTAIDSNMEFEFMHDFIPTLKQFHTGNLIIIDYGLSERALNALESNIIIISKKDSSNKITPNRRIKDYYEAISGLHPSDRVLVVDSGDVWFQDSLEPYFADFGDRIACVEERLMSDSGFNLNCINQLSLELREEVYFYSQGQHLINAGMLASTAHNLKKLYYDTLIIMDSENSDFFAYDQTLINYVLRRYCQLELLPIKCNAVLINHEDMFDAEEGIIYETNTYDKVTMVHNAGNTSRIYPQNCIRRQKW